MNLDIELKAFEAALPTLLSNTGKFAVVHGAAIDGVFTSYEDALKSAYEKFGLDQFLVKKISPAEQVAYISRVNSAPCQA